MNKYLIVDSKVLPDVFEKVVEVKKLIHTGKAKDISEGVKKIGISRSTYYKYKDSVFTLSESSKGRKATIGLLLEHEAGTLSTILDEIAKFQGNILTINQDIPINNAANVNITFNVANLNIDLRDLIDNISKLKSVVKVDLVAME